jgi:hypothetical protein
VLNLRRSLSTAYVGLRANGDMSWTNPININALISKSLTGRIGWLDHPTFHALAHRSG